jgi:peptide deformylase
LDKKKFNVDKIKEVLKVGSKNLLKKSTPFDVSKLKNKSSMEFKLLEDLKKIVKIEDSYGVSAIQINSPKRIFIGLDPDKFKDFNSNYETQVFINPKILDQSSEQERDLEGCLSVPGFVDYVLNLDTLELFQDQKRLKLNLPLNSENYFEDPFLDILRDAFCMNLITWREFCF